jgi:hypothetical protein
MRTTRHLLARLLPVVGMGLVLAGPFGGPVLPAASAAGVKPFTSQDDWSAQSLWGYQNPGGQQDYWRQHHPWGQQAPWGYQHDRPSRRSRYGLPDRYTIHKGKKCELRCERIRGTREYSCREYRC